MVSDYGINMAMEEISISKFKATCLSVLEEVRKTRRPIRVTRFGKPVAEVVAPSIPVRPAGWLGSLAGTGRIVGDIVSPATEDREWNALGE
jgi:prevent-host-death family protein